MSDGTDRENVSVFIVANLIVKDRDEYNIYEKGFSRCSKSTAVHLSPTMMNTKRSKASRLARGEW